ncbi:hypothetical protein RRG08_004408 [Elysia crispata]|uniref:Uncharacterized protein n=1 Tax=Elysia crispata TaxID=231223 RepID=A0AAE1EBS6_9GAST|nr:hypothetical protein RRG08_004408 [Elysia crispata]
MPYPARYRVKCLFASCLIALWFDGILIPGSRSAPSCLPAPQPKAPDLILLPVPRHHPRPGTGAGGRSRTSQPASPRARARGNQPASPAPARQPAAAATPGQPASPRARARAQPTARAAASCGTGSNSSFKPTLCMAIAGQPASNNNNMSCLRDRQHDLPQPGPHALLVQIPEHGVWWLLLDRQGFREVVKFFPSACESQRVQIQPETLAQGIYSRRSPLDNLFAKKALVLTYSSP